MRRSLVVGAMMVVSACGGSRPEPTGAGGGSMAGGTAEPMAGGMATMGSPPSITTQPQAVSVEETASATFTVAATGEGLTYQWLRDGVAITDATGPGFTLAAARAFDDGARFSVRVQNASGAVTSAEARLTVTLKGIAVSADGGTVSSPDGLITLILPPGAITADATIRFRPVEPPPLPADAGAEDFAEGFPQRSWDLELTGAEFAAGPGFGVTMATPDPVRTETTYDPSETGLVRLCPDETALALGGNGGLCGAVTSMIPCSTNQPSTTVSLRRYRPIFPRPNALAQTIGSVGDDTIRRTFGGANWTAVVWDRRNTDPLQAFMTVFQTNGTAVATIPLAPEEDPIAHDGLGTFTIRIGRREGVSSTRCELSIRSITLSTLAGGATQVRLVEQAGQTFPISPGCTAPTTGLMTLGTFSGTNLNRLVELSPGKALREWALPAEISPNYPRLLAQAGRTAPLWVLGMSTMGCPNPCPYVASVDPMQTRPAFAPAVRLGDGRGVRSSPAGYRLVMAARGRMSGQVWVAFGATERTTSSPSFAGRIAVVGVDVGRTMATTGAFLPGSEALEPAGLDLDGLGRPVVVTTYGAYADGMQNDQGIYAYRVTPGSTTVPIQNFRLRDMSAAPGLSYSGGQNRGGGWLDGTGAVLSVSIDLGNTGLTNRGCSGGSTGCGDVLLLRTAL
jgi:hypothetical protein